MCSDNVLKLGEKLVAELDLDESVDTLGRWMAHYIAEKIEEAESATGEDRALKMILAQDAILNLWDHRSSLPRGARPFKDFDPIFRALQSLDPEDSTPRYFSQIRDAASEEDEADETKQWLTLASGIDDVASFLIRHCLGLAAQGAVERTREWVKLAEDVASKDNIDIRIMLAVANDADAVNSNDPDDEEKNKREKFLKKLEEFMQLANEMSAMVK